MAHKIKVVIADDHPLMLNGLKYTLRSDPVIEIVGEASDGDKAIVIINKQEPDIAILDYDMPHVSGLDVAQELIKSESKVKVIFFTMNNDSKIFNKAINLGVKGYLLKDSIEDEILDAVHEVMEGGTFISPELSKYLIDRNSRANDISAIIEHWKLLTPTEINVLKLAAGNKSTEEIAAKLFVSKRTIDRHRENICKKLDIHGYNAILHFVYKYRDLILSLEQ